MPNLHRTINDLAERFAHDLVRALRDASLADILAETSARHVKRGGRPAALVAGAPRGRERRSPDDLAKLAQRIIVAVHAAGKKGINAEALRAKLAVQRNELPRPLTMALKTRNIKKKGVKRATTYFGT